VVVVEEEEEGHACHKWENTLMEIWGKRKMEGEKQKRIKACCLVSNNICSMTFWLVFCIIS
jgi:hypothetical protein